MQECWNDEFIEESDEYQWKNDNEYGCLLTHFLDSFWFRIEDEVKDGCDYW